MRVLILGGTTEASAVARQLAGDARFDITLSLAGRTASPATIPGITSRVGGFGGADRLAHWLKETGIAAVIDATHPFAAEMSRNAHAATETLGLPLCTLVRPPWVAQSGDRWRVVASMDEAADALGAAPLRAFLSIGRQGVGAFWRAPQHTYVLRTIEPPDPDALPPATTLIRAKGPFALQDETDLLASQRIDVLVTKNAGGAATYAKIEAARDLGIPVVMVDRPAKAGPYVVANAHEVIDWLERLHKAPRSERGV